MKERDKETCAGNGIRVAWEKQQEQISGWIFGRYDDDDDDDYDVDPRVGMHKPQS